MMVWKFARGWPHKNLSLGEHRPPPYNTTVRGAGVRLVRVIFEMGDTALP